MVLLGLYTPTEDLSNSTMGGKGRCKVDPVL